MTILLNQPTSWKGSSNETPPHNYQQVTSDGRFWWKAPPGQSMGSDGGITYILAANTLPAAFNLNWQITVPAEQGNVILSINGAANNLGATVGSGTIPLFGANLSALVLTFNAGLGTPYNAIVAISFSIPTPPSPTGHGDIPNPNTWQDLDGNIPPIQYQAIPDNVTNFPLNGDGRYWYVVSATDPSADGIINFIGDPAFLTGSATLQWTIVQEATDGSSLNIGYAVDGITFTSTTIGPQQQLNGLLSGGITAALTGAFFTVQATASGGVADPTALPWIVAIAITRNNNEGLNWDAQDPYDPINYNCECADDVTPTDTLANLRSRMMIRLGFSNQASNPPPGMAALINDFLSSGQTFLYRRYLQLHTKRFFRWKVNPGQRFYSLKDNDDDVLCNFLMDPMKQIEWAGIQDSRNVWYPLIRGIPPQLYTMITKPWRPARYDIRQCIEVYPAPDQTYFLWFKAHFGLMSFASDSDKTTIDSELVFLHALANAKSHYGQPDANNIEAQANAYRAELVAGTHQTAHYIPGTIAVPPAVRPTLVQFDNQGS